jgi:hypothetical protein
MGTLSSPSAPAPSVSLIVLANRSFTQWGEIPFLWDRLPQPELDDAQRSKGYGDITFEKTLEQQPPRARALDQRLAIAVTMLAECPPIADDDRMKGSKTPTRT